MLHTSPPESPPPRTHKEPTVHNSWQPFLEAERHTPHLAAALAAAEAERAAGHEILPPAADVFNAFAQTPPDRVKAVILGQDPYHTPGLAHGLAFSVRPGLPVPPSLANIYKELAADIPGFTPPSHGCLNAWAGQGVLLLNTVLTVRAHSPGSHARLGWETFTDRVIAHLNTRRRHLVFLLWGGHARKKAALIDPGRHLILEAPHPSPLSAHRGFFGCRHFSRTNTYLRAHGQTEIDWRL